MAHFHIFDFQKVDLWKNVQDIFWWNYFDIRLTVFSPNLQQEQILSTLNIA